MEREVLTCEARNVEDFEDAVAALTRMLKCYETVRTLSDSETQTLISDFLNRRGEPEATVALRYSSRTAEEYQDAIASLSTSLGIRKKRTR